MKGLNILLTGACGRIGKTFFEASKDRYRFTLTDRVTPDFELGDHRFVHADLSDKSALVALLDGIDVIVHLSGIPHASASFMKLMHFGSIDWVPTPPPPSTILSGRSNRASL